MPQPGKLLDNIKAFDTQFAGGTNATMMICNAFCVPLNLAHSSSMLHLPVPENWLLRTVLREWLGRCPLDAAAIL